MFKKNIYIIDFEIYIKQKLKNIKLKGDGQKLIMLRITMQ